MNKIIEEQLKNVVYADLSNYDEKTNTFFIKKYTKPVFLSGKCYIIRVNKQIINNSYSVLATNWNNGLSPKNEYYKAYVSKTLGKMIYCDCLAVDYKNKKDLTEVYSGWFNIEDLTQLEVGK